MADKKITELENMLKPVLDLNIPINTLINEFERLNELERWKEWDETKIAVRQQIIDGVNATYRKLSREAAREFVKIWGQEVHDELPLVVWYQTKPSRDVTEGRRKSLDELQKEVNQFIEKWHRKPHKAVEKDWDRGDDLEL